MMKIIYKIYISTEWLPISKDIYRYIDLYYSFQQLVKISEKKNTLKLSISQ